MVEYLLSMICNASLQCSKSKGIDKKQCVAKVLAVGGGDRCPSTSSLKCATLG